MDSLPLLSTNTSQYTSITQEQMLRFSTMCTGLYSELLITNFSRIDIMVIDERNNRVVVSPCAEAPYRGTIQIEHRSTNKPREKRGREGVSELAMPGTRIILPDWLVFTGSYMVESLNLLITNSTIGANVLHPMSSPVYTGALVQSIEQACPFNEQTTMRFIANDPKGRIKMLYGAVSDRIFEIPCTHAADSESEHASLNIVLSSPTRTFIHNRIDVEEVITSGLSFTDTDEFVIAIGLTAAEAEQAVRARKKHKDQQVIESANIRMKYEREEMADDKAKMEAAHAAELTDQKETINKLKAKLEMADVSAAQLKMKLQTEEMKAAEWQSLYKVHLDKAEAEERERKARAAADSETLKVASVVWKVAAGVVVAVAVPIIKHYIAVTTQKE